MDESPHSKETKPANRSDSVYEIKFEMPSDEATHEGCEEARDQAASTSPVVGIYEFVANDTTACLAFLRTLKLEVIALIYMFSYIMRGVSSTTMIIDKVCLVHMGYSESFCANLEENKTIKTEVEKLANNYSLLHTLLQIVPSAFLACFIGPWSDRYGRKLPITIALIGIILDGIGSMACAGYRYSRIEYYAACALFTGLSGGVVSVLTVMYSWASDTTTLKNRTLKYTLLELAFGIGLPLGSLAGGLIYRYSGYLSVFSVSVAGHCFGLLWVFLVIQETRGLDNKDPLRVKLASFFTYESLMDAFRTVSKRRPHRARLQIWLLVLTMCIAVLTFASTSGINYMFAYHQYSWGNTKYSTVSSVFSVISMVSLIIFVPLLTKVWKIGDAGLGIVGSISVISKNITLSFAEYEGLYYLANLLGLFTAMANLAGRSRISKIVDKGDLGKVFSFVSTAETLLPILGTTVFVQLYNVSLNIEFPGLVFLILGLLMVISLFVFIWIAFLPAVFYDALQEDKAPNGENSAEVGEKSVEVGENSVEVGENSVEVAKN